MSYIESLFPSSLNSESTSYSAERHNKFWPPKNSKSYLKNCYFYKRIF